MYPKTNFRTPFPGPGIACHDIRINSLINAAGVAFARGEKSRARKLCVRLFKEQLKVRHRISGTENRDAWLRASGWAAVFAVWAGRPTTAKRLVNAALSQAQPDTFLGWILKDQRKALEQLQTPQSQAEIGIPAPTMNPGSAGC